MPTTCGRCGFLIPDDDDYCGNCGAPRPSRTDNYCINPNCERYKKVLDNPKQQFCGKCGKPTAFGNYIQKASQDF